MKDIKLIGGEEILYKRDLAVRSLIRDAEAIVNGQDPKEGDYIGGIPVSPNSPRRGPTIESAELPRPEPTLVFAVGK